MDKILIANRGEAAVRIARAGRDAGIATVAVYTAHDRDAPHIRLCDEAFALDGGGYLDIERILAAAALSGADAVHPGWGFLAENAEFAQAVIDAGLTWIGPPPQVIRDLGDKVAARRIALRAGAPLAPGTTQPAAGPEDVAAFAREHGLPVAVKAAFGGGGRGLKVARTMEEITACYESAVRESLAAFGRGECFAERYLDRPRHVETQCLADRHGTVVVVSTRDCSLQRRHQKVVEEAPAPHLTDQQRATLYATSKAILREAGYVGAGTCEFLVAATGEIYFLEVNTRLQVEHPVSEEITGLDLVREMFRIADGEHLGYSDPPARGHSIEFRINGEDAGRNFLPGPGTITAWRPPDGPGVRVDSGVEQGTSVGTAYDSLLAKLIVTGADRRTALDRARRALREFQIEGLATLLPFHRAIVTDPAFTETFSVHTQWIHDEFGTVIPPYEGHTLDGPAPIPLETVVVEVGGRRVELRLPAEPRKADAGRAVRTRTAANTRSPNGRASAGGPAVTSPMQGTVVTVAVSDGQPVSQGDVLLVLEAMKMEQPLLAHRTGTVRNLSVTIGETVQSGAVLCTIDGEAS